ncbi:hypothetical protein EVC45_45015 [Paraburkholderia sp. UYCP14C]|uniref:hypothetical protein n=1 Tax=Paraburkholderia sp. UYCP14C TaxID=2511130 RepID=UPI001022111C|nr:hypothetical protein [Paraburkholderia sp. UYCP14C]RZF23369.1 hypothetical protein EVC45_45015 [Paraburkholderia sp. UYCP14C]
MTVQPITSLNLCAANLTLALQMQATYHETLKRNCDLGLQRIRRDIAAVQAICDVAVAARDCTELAASYLIMSRDYVATTRDLWQQGLLSLAPDIKTT